MTDETKGLGGESEQKPAPQGNSAPVEKSAPSGVPHVSSNFQKERDDIAKILKEVQLPERRASGLSGERQIPREVKPIDALLSGDTSPTPASSSAAMETTPAPRMETSGVAEQNAEESTIVSVHTLKDDLQHVVHDQKISVVRAVALEEQKRGTREDEPAISAPSHRTRGILFAVGLLSLLGIAALAGVYIAMESRSAPLPQTQSDSLVFAESSVTLSLDGTMPSALKAQLGNARQGVSASLGSITRIVPILSPAVTDGSATQARAATFSEFMHALGAHPPESLVRALADNFFLGIHTVDKNAPVFVIPVTSYDRAFAGMLEWERAMNADLAPLFTPVPALVEENGIPEQRSFTDVVMRNYDVRALKDDGGQIELYYSFPTRDILVIAESPYTFTEILTRLQALRHL